MTFEISFQAWRRNRFAALAAAVLAAAITGGCASTAVTYSYEPRFSLPAASTYQWGKAKTSYLQEDALLEANVRFLANRALEEKGLTERTDKAGLIIWISYKLDPVYSNRYDLLLLELNIARTDDNVLLWRGQATGTIKTDAASGGLKKAVEEMFTNFPPNSSLPVAAVQPDSP